MIKFIKEKKFSIIVFLILVIQVVFLRLKGSGIVNWDWMKVFSPIMILLFFLSIFLLSILFHVVRDREEDDA